MAWLDDRFLSHPKVIQLPDRAKLVCLAGILYSSGFGTRGHLPASALKAIGATKSVRNLIVNAGLWDEENGEIYVHDWDNYNLKRDDKREEKRAADRERQRRHRAKKAEDVTRDSHGLSRVTVTEDVTPEKRDSPAGARDHAGPRPDVHVHVQGEEQEQQQSSKEDVALDDARANGRTGEGSAAAATRAEAPTQAAIDQALGTLKATDKGSFARVAPLAEQLPADVFDQVLERVHDRKTTGTIKNDVGLLVDLLRTTIRAVKCEAAAEHAARIANLTPREELASLGRGYALSEIPWDAAHDLLDLKLRRSNTSPDEHAKLLQAAREAYEQAADPEPIVSTTAK